MTETKAAVRPAAASHPAAGTTRHRSDIDGLRGVAIVLVILFHAGVPGVAGGYLGVDVFFVVSGFLLTTVLLTESSPTRFLGRRALRILPATSVVLIAVVLASHHWLGSLRGAEIAEDARWSAFLVADLRFADLGVDYLAAQNAPSPLQHLWALAVVEQFSLIWPAAVGLLIWLGFRWALGWLLAAAVAAAFAYSALQEGATWSYFAPATRAWELGAGCLLALAAGRLHRIPARIATVMAGVGLAVIVVAALTFDTVTPLPGYAAAVPVAATLLVLAGRGEALLGRAPLRWLGRLSFALYLWHWPVLVIAEQRYGGPLPGWTRAVLVLLSLVLAVATYVGVQKPVRVRP